MPKKRTTTSRKKTQKSSSLRTIEKELNKEVKEVEQWIIQRKKFLVKLLWILVGISILIIVLRIL